MSKTPPSPPSHWPAIILFLAAIGIPSAAGISFAQTITQHPWQAVGIALLYEAGVVFVGFLAGIWQQLQTTWVKRIADWIDARAQMLFSGYWKHYRQYLTYEHRDFDVKGLSTQGTYTLSLEQVFVELSIDPRAPHQTSTNPLQIFKELSPGEHPIWEYLCAASLKTQQLVLLGPPGSGKTTLLKHMALTLTTTRKPLRQQKVPYTTPFLLLLREYSASLQETPDFSLVDAIHAHLKKWERPVPSGWVKRRLESGRCLILLDGSSLLKKSLPKRFN
jgi:NACHT domain